jgi:hypothetical protein
VNAYGYQVHHTVIQQATHRGRCVNSCHVHRMRTVVGSAARCSFSARSRNQEMRLFWPRSQQGHRQTPLNNVTGLSGQSGPSSLSFDNLSSISGPKNCRALAVLLFFVEIKGPRSLQLICQGFVRSQGEVTCGRRNGGSKEIFPALRMTSIV